MSGTLALFVTGRHVFTEQLLAAHLVHGRCRCRHREQSRKRCREASALKQLPIECPELQGRVREHRPRDEKLLPLRSAPCKICILPMFSDACNMSISKVSMYSINKSIKTRNIYWRYMSQILFSDNILVVLVIKMV